ncbi:hypothetical protein [Cytophaga hutchinsonii]|jgi:hypothetical protein|uniref:Outer membrane protein beta-barrel domain-containing protein n=1 Tax=Cytophaga hutchinsonii (strain ATCC 33406 / DSM 1761 / CIP 103989 / NBRC 15051 / NCIMB 9469 / D465) TaxID=269798 RepID=A0A6N4SM22_CYTH3|nr:hypothetical protein [Cytophaga hutchinsonii]ABG57301.1 hypothetical protein CHU_0007 [Cytophaga hutchinsonii ATCC 33406]SFX45909.1 hypothetical protein SAMN04487930_104200 [Cytophaga hutchinsonii ATCC 33406]
MKKIITIASLLAFTLAANAQQETTVTTTTTVPVTRAYKPGAGDVLAEIGFLAGGIGANPTSLQNSAFGGVSPQLKFRYFLQDQVALRIGFGFTQTAEKNRYYEANPGSGEGFARDAYSRFDLNAGLEKHFTGTGRLSTYVGADLLFQKVGASTKWENSDGNTFVDGQKRQTKGFNTAGDNASFGFGLRAVSGADYYFVEKVYLGAEFGWGFVASKEGKTKDETTPAGGGATNTVETKSTGGTFNLAPSLTAGLRLGFIF